MNKLDLVPLKIDKPLTVSDILSIGDDLDDINSAFKHQAEIYGWASQLYSKAKSSVRMRQHELEMYEARLKTKYRRTRSESKPTVDMVKAWVITRKGHVRRTRELEDARYYEEVLQGVVRALEHKREALMGLGANIRHQLEPELRMLARKLRK